MTKQQFLRATSIQAQIQEATDQIRIIEGGKCVSVKFRRFNDDTGQYEDLELTNGIIPRGYIKLATIEKIKNHKASLERGFDGLGAEKQSVVDAFNELIKDIE